MNGHPTREEDFDLYALGTLEGDEKQAIESHLATCAACTRKLDEARGRMALLALSAPRTEPSPAVKERLLHRVREPAPAGVREPVRVERERAGGMMARWWAAVLVPAFAILLIASAYLWNINARLDREIVALRASIQDQQKQLDYARSVAHLLEAKDTLTVSLAPMPGMPQGAVKVMYNEKMGMLMYDGWIEPPPQDKSYQLWVLPMEGQPISVGVVNPATSDTAHWLTKVPEGVTAKTIAITLEPAGGMPQPTGPMVLVSPGA